MLQSASDFVINDGMFVSVAGNLNQTTHVSNYHEGKKIKILEWLGAPNPSNLYNAAWEKQCAGTGSWFLQGETYRRWKREANLPVIIYGSPGYGKTVLCSTIIKDIQDHCEKAGPTSTYAYFFFDGRDSQDEFQLYQRASS